MLLSAAARSTESTLLLASYGQLWDAEVVLRSVFEASMKFAYIVQTHENFEKRHDDFAEHQFQMALMKDDQKARDLLAALRDPNAPAWKPIRDMVLPDGERDHLRGKYDKAARRAVETRWGYAGLLNALTNSGDKVYEGFAGLAHGYAISSHIGHADYVGVSIPLERDLREPERRNAVHMTHLARLISDCFTCFLLRLNSVYRLISCDTAPLSIVAEQVSDLCSAMSPYYDDWLQMEYGNAPDE